MQDGGQSPDHSVKSVPGYRSGLVGYTVQYLQRATLYVLRSSKHATYVKGTCVMHARQGHLQRTYSTQCSPVLHKESVLMWRTSRLFASYVVCRMVQLQLCWNVCMEHSMHFTVPRTVHTE